MIKILMIEYVLMCCTFAPLFLIGLMTGRIVFNEGVKHDGKNSN